MKLSNDLNKVFPVNLRRLFVAEKIQFFGLVIKIIEKYLLSKSKELAAVSAAFKKSFQELESRFNKAKNPEVSIQLIEIDDLRDNDIICLRMTADSLARHFDPEINSAARLLLETIDLYGSAIYRMNYEEETIVLRNLVNDLKTRPNLVSAVEKLHLTSLVENLEKNNNEFQDLYVTRLEEKTNEESSVAEYIKETSLQYRALIRTLESIAFLDSKDSSSNIIADINTLVQRHQEKLQYRESRKTKTNESPEDAAMTGETLD